MAPGTQPPPDPWELGRRFEAGLDPDRRRALGAWHTPPDLAGRAAAWALDRRSRVENVRFPDISDTRAPAGADPPVVCDPACGGGAFLLAAAEGLAALGHERQAVVERMVAMDVDADAAGVTSDALALWSGGARPRTVVLDALVEEWPVRPDVVVGNPPFLGQLSSATARSRDRRAVLRARWGRPAAGYVDDAALFLLAATHHLAPGGAVAMVLPESMLATASADAVRRRVAPLLRAVWLEGAGHFDAPVRVCDVGLADDADAPVPWSGAIADALGVPVVAPRAGRDVLGDHASATGGFRDEYYGLVPHVGEWEPGRAPLVTSGLVDPARCRWGERPARFAKRAWQRPSVRVDDLDGLRPWAERHLRPKLLVATRTRVLEAVADPEGGWLPVTPVLAVLPRDPGRLDHLLAAVLSPVASAWAVREAGGSGLSAGAVRLSAEQLRRLPLPAPGGDWDAAAAAVGRGDVAGAALPSCRAHGLDEATAAPLVEWWAARLPRRPRR